MCMGGELATTPISLFIPSQYHVTSGASNFNYYIFSELSIVGQEQCALK